MIDLLKPVRDEINSAESAALKVVNEDKSWLRTNRAPLIIGFSIGVIVTLLFWIKFH